MRDTGATRQWSDAAVLTVLITMLALTGCVTKESYTQQVNRTTNLQRLLAEEEKRSSDLVNDVARLKSQVNDLEAQNKVISDQLKESRAQVVRSLEEVGRLQEEGQSRRPSVKSKRQGVAPAAARLPPPDRAEPRSPPGSDRRRTGRTNDRPPTQGAPGRATNPRPTMDRSRRGALQGQPVAHPRRAEAVRAPDARLSEVQGRGQSRRG